MILQSEMIKPPDCLQDVAGSCPNRTVNMLTVRVLTVATYPLDQWNLQLQSEMIKPTNCLEDKSSSCPDCGSERVKESGGLYIL
jgi:hypothetical protein